MENIIDINFVYGYRFKKSWYYASRLNFEIQFWKCYNYDKKPPQKISNFLSPVCLLVGFGLNYRPDDHLTLNLHTLTSRMTFVTDKNAFKTYDENGNPTAKAKACSVDPDGSFRYELGAYLGARYKMQLIENMSLENRLGYFPIISTSLRICACLIQEL